MAKFRIDTLDTSPTTDAQRAAMQNSLQGAMRDIGTAQGRMIDARASGGAQLSANETAASLREANNITLKDTLSGLRDLDWAEALAPVAEQISAVGDFLRAELAAGRGYARSRLPPARAVGAIRAQPARAGDGRRVAGACDLPVRFRAGSRVRTRIAATTARAP